MKKSLLTMAGVLSIIFSVNAQNPVEGQVTMGAGYANRVFYNLETQTETPYSMTNWDLAFYRKSNQDMGVKINDAKNLEVYEVSANLSDWSTIDVANESEWTKLYNSETTMKIGAFDNGSAAFGWGTYNPTTHKVMGSIIFVIKKPAATGSPVEYTKIKMDEYFGGYTFTYSKLNAGVWSEDVTKTIANTTNPTKIFNYYSFAVADEVQAEPEETAWDLLFTKYTDYYGTSGLMTVNGVLSNPNVKVAQTLSAEGNTEDLLEEMNVIGHDWKSINYETFQYDVSSDINYFVKRNNSDVVYKINFTEFAGTATGVVKFNIDNTATLSVEEVAPGVSFEVYPNPSTDKIVNVVYDIQTANSAQNTITIYSLSGAVVHHVKANSQSGFYSQVLDLNQLSTGMYMLEFKSGDKSEMKKIILK